MRRAVLGVCLGGALLASTAGSAGAATLAPTSANFGTQAVGTVSAPRSFTLTPELLDLLTLRVSTTGDYIQTNNCPAVLQLLSGPCTINVRFAPTASGTRRGTLSTTTLLVGGPSASLSGVGSGSGSLRTAGSCKRKRKKKAKKGAVAAKKKSKKCSKKKGKRKK
jgi:hypothetical protein